MDKIAVVIPVYNQAYALAQTLFAFQRQTVPAGQYQIVVVDDGSDDPIRAVVEAYEDDLSIEYLRLPRSGRAAARNRGAEQAQRFSDLLLFCDADRMPRAEFVEAHLHAHRRHPDALVVGQVREMYISDYENRTDEIRDRLIRGTGDRMPQYCRLVTTLFDADGTTKSQVAWISALSGNMSVSCDVYEKIGRFDENFDGWGFEHMEFGFRAHELGIPFVYEKQAVNVHLAHSRKQMNYASNMRNSHQYFYRKHPKEAVRAYLPFMLGEISLWELEWRAGGDVGDVVDEDACMYVRITQFEEGKR